MIVAGLSLLVLVAYVIYNAVISAPPSSPGAGPPTQAPTATAPMVDLRPLEEAVQRDPDKPAPLLQLANALHDNREFARAIATYERYLRLVPGNPDARVDMGICYFELAQQSPERAKEYFERALAVMEEALKQSPTHQPAAFNLGIVNLQMGNLQASNDWLERAVELGKDTPLGQRARNILEQHTTIP
jgi:Tfp pilus assembly protein PilF